MAADGVDRANPVAAVKPLPGPVVAGVVALLTLLFALAGAGSGTGADHGGGGPARTGLGPRILLDVTASAAVLALLLVAALVVALLRSRSRGERRPEDHVVEPPPVPWALRLALILLPLLLALGFVALVRSAGDDVPVRPRPELPVVPTEPRSAPRGGGVAIDWPVVAALAAAAVALTAAAGVRGRQRRRRVAVGGGRRTGIAEAEVSGCELDDLLVEPDRRRAVVAAYARMERLLAADGAPRRPGEAPFEYLGRVAAAIGAATPAAARLTELFERAKFSHRDVDARMRTEAVTALAVVRDSTAGPS